MIEQRIYLEKAKIISGSQLEDIAKELLKSLQNTPENTVSKAVLKKLKIVLDPNHLTSLLCEAVERRCPVLASYLYSAGALAYTPSSSKKTAVHHALDANTGLEELLLTHLGGSLYTMDLDGRMPHEIMNKTLKEKMEEVSVFF